MFSKEEKSCHKMVYYTLYLSKANRQISCYKVRIYTDEKLTFLKGACHLKELIWQTSFVPQTVFHD